MSKLPCTWNGVDYPSIRQASIATGITECKLTRYLKKGYTCSGDLRLYSWDGIKYATVAEVAEAAGVCTTTMYNWIRQGYIPATRTRSCRVNGRRYSTLAAAARELGYTRSRLQQVVAEYGSDLLHSEEAPIWKST